MKRSAHTATSAAPPTHEPAVPREPAAKRTAAERLWAWRDGDDADRLVALAVLGALIEVFLLILLQRFPLGRWFPGPGFSVGFPQMMSGDWRADQLWLAIVLAAPYLGFVPALWFVRDLRGRLATAIVAAFALLFGLTLLYVYPITAADLFHYVADARTLWVFHQNPMQVAPNAHRLIIDISWAQQPSPYGPLWQVISALPIALTGDHALASVVAFKALGLLSYLVCAALIYLIVRRTWPGRELFAALAFAWNPFVVFRAVGNGHNDLTMMAFALAAFYFIAQRRWRWALPLLALSICIKYSTAVIVPPVLLYAWVTSDGRERRALLSAGLIALGCALLIFAPFWRGFDTFRTFVQNTQLHITSVPELFSIWLEPGLSRGAAEDLSRNLGYAIFAAVYLALLAGVWRRRSFNALLAACALAFTAYLTLGTWWFRPWYFLWFIPLAALLPSFWWTAVSVGASLGCTFFDLVEQYRTHYDWAEKSLLRAYSLPVICAFVPLLLLVLVGMIATGRWTLLGHGDEAGLASRGCEPPPISTA